MTRQIQRAVFPFIPGAGGAALTAGWKCLGVTAAPHESGPGIAMSFELNPEAEAESRRFVILTNGMDVPDGAEFLGQATATLTVMPKIALPNAKPEAQVVTLYVFLLAKEAA